MSWKAPLKKFKSCTACCWYWLSIWPVSPFLFVWTWLACKIYAILLSIKFLITLPTLCNLLICLFCKKMQIVFIAYFYTTSFCVLVHWNRISWRICSVTGSEFHYFSDLVWRTNYKHINAYFYAAPGYCATALLWFPKLEDERMF